MNFAQTIDPDMPMIARRSWCAVLAQLSGEPVPAWCLPEPSAVQRSARNAPLDTDDDEVEDEPAEGVPVFAERDAGGVAALV